MHLLSNSSGPRTFLHRTPSVLVRYHLILIRVCVRLLLVLVLLMMILLLLLATGSSFRMITVAIGLPKTVLLVMIPSSAMAALRELLLTTPILATKVSFSSFLSAFLSTFAFVVLALAVPPFVLSFSFSATTSSAAASSTSLA